MDMWLVVGFCFVFRGYCFLSIVVLFRLCGVVIRVMIILWILVLVVKFFCWIVCWWLSGYGIRRWCYGCFSIEGGILGMFFRFFRVKG